MIYDSLLLNCGGGIIPASKQSKQYSGSAALAIGIGGTGVAALCNLKSKVHQQLISDDPSSPIARYQHIQFLAIDSDESILAEAKGNARLEKSEFFSICNPTLPAMLGGAGKNTIMNDPRFSWMNIDKIDRLLNPQGAGGIRQVGRYLLIDKANDLKTKIISLCTNALAGMGKPSLDVYIFAGISGGTGSGCFLDTCYIVKQALLERGYDSSANVMGFFFLPDVVTSKSEVAAKPANVSYNNSNGYAAMKELDYLMNLKTANDWFTQNYGGFRVHTQEPPVSMSYLISAQNSSGSIMKDGFHYCINVAADYVMSYLADVELGNATAGGAGDTGLTARGHLANVTQGVAQIRRQYGANLSYHILGGSNAEIPMTQIATYLAAGFYQKFQASVGRSKVVLSKSVVNDWFRSLRLDADSIRESIASGSGMLDLPDIDYGVLRSLGTMPEGKSPEPWAIPGNQWLSTCDGVYTTNRAALNGMLDRSYLASKAAAGSLLGTIFKKLVDLCQDPNYGPYYAVQLLNNKEYDFMSCIKGAIEQLRGEKDTQQLYLNGHNHDGLEHGIMQSSADFCTAGTFNRGSRYGSYKQAVMQYYGTLNRIQQLDAGIYVLETLQHDLADLYKKYCLPLISLLDNLQDTFREDLIYLESDAAKGDGAYTWRILEFSDIKPHLNAVLETLTPNQYVRNFLQAILSMPDTWMKNDGGAIAKMINQHMEQVFASEMNQSLQDYLGVKFPAGKDDPQILSNLVKDNIIQVIHNNATPMFWRNPSFTLNASTCFETSSISVPGSATAICTAANAFKEGQQQYTVRQTGLSDRLFALRFCSGLPLYAYQGITLLKKTYDEAANAQSGVGSHLYFATGRGKDGSGDRDWRFYLPTPMAYSFNPELVPEGASDIALYDKGEKAGIICQHSTTPSTDEYDVGADENAADAATPAEGATPARPTNPAYFIRKTPDFSLDSYTLQDFLLEDGSFNAGKMEAARNKIEDLRTALLSGPAEEIDLLNDGDLGAGEDVVTRVRKDYFIHFPVLKAIVRNELKKLAKLDKALQALNELNASFASYDEDLTDFTDMLFYRILEPVGGTGKPSYDKIAQIVYDFKLANGTPKTHIFVNNACSKEEREYPLHTAFLSYRDMFADDLPRREMLEKLQECRQRTLTPGLDNVPAAKLAKEWNFDTLRLLERSLANATIERRQAVMEFHRGLVNRLNEFRDKFTAEEWAMVSPAGTAAPGTAVPPAPPVTLPLPLWDGAQYLYLNDLNSTQCYTADGRWLPLTAQLQMYNTATGAWTPVRLSPNGTILL